MSFFFFPLPQSLPPSLPPFLPQILSITRHKAADGATWCDNDMPSDLNVELSSAAVQVGREGKEGRREGGRAACEYLFPSLQ